MRGFPHRSTPSARWARSWRPIMTKPRSIVERYFAAFCAGDVDAAMACVHPDAIWHVDGDPVVGTVGVIKGCDAVRARSEERRVGKECVSTCRSRWSPYH